MIRCRLQDRELRGAQECSGQPDMYEGTSSVVQDAVWFLAYLSPVFAGRFCLVVVFVLPYPCAQPFMWITTPDCGLLSCAVSMHVALALQRSSLCTAWKQECRKKGSGWCIYHRVRMWSLERCGSYWAVNCMLTATSLFHEM
jgi:hypothetical protein